MSLQPLVSAPARGGHRLTLRTSPAVDYVAGLAGMSALLPAAAQPG